jgi:hypothetical protein
VLLAAVVAFEGQPVALEFFPVGLGPNLGIESLFHVVAVSSGQFDHLRVGPIPEPMLIVDPVFVHFRALLQCRLRGRRRVHRRQAEMKFQVNIRIRRSLKAGGACFDRVMPQR